MTKTKKTKTLKEDLGLTIIKKMMMVTPYDYKRGEVFRVFEEREMREKSTGLLIASKTGVVSFDNIE